MMNKEECMEALNEIETIYYDMDDSFSGLMCFGKSIEKIAKLINEHFELKKDYDYLNLKVIEQNMREMNYLIDRSNPPLKFEDLEIGVPYWDNQIKKWIYFLRLHEYIETGIVVEISDIPLTYAFRFEENRFYRYEVKE